MFSYTATLIFMHGLGDTGSGWMGILRAIQPRFMKIICPTANSIPISAYERSVMPAWFDKHTATIESSPVDQNGVNQSTALVHNYINSEKNAGIPSNRIIVGGFSQGAALALYSGLTYPDQLGGIIALSGWLMYPQKFANIKATTRKTPIFIGHGTADQIVPYSFGEDAMNNLNGFIDNLQFNSYNGVEHTASDKELDDVKHFIEKNLV